MNAFKVNCDNGNSWVTSMNATLPQAVAYFMGQCFTRESDEGVEIIDQVVSVEVAGGVQ